MGGIAPPAGLHGRAQACHVRGTEEGGTLERRCGGGWASMATGRGGGTDRTAAQATVRRQRRLWLGDGRAVRVSTLTVNPIYAAAALGLMGRKLPGRPAFTHPFPSSSGPAGLRAPGSLATGSLGHAPAPLLPIFSFLYFFLFSSSSTLISM